MSSVVTFVNTVLAGLIGQKVAEKLHWVHSAEILNLTKQLQERDDTIRDLKLECLDRESSAYKTAYGRCESELLRTITLSWWVATEVIKRGNNN